jgi:hypothetical protein
VSQETEREMHQIDLAIERINARVNRLLQDREKLMVRRNELVRHRY